MAPSRRKRLRQLGSGTGASMAKQYSPGNITRRGWSGTAVRAVATGAAVLLAMTACGSKPSESASSDSDKPIVIGISLPLTGDFSQPGGEARKGYEIWADQVNADGGLLGRQVKLKSVGHARHQNPGATPSTKLITEDRVDRLLGTFSSLLNFPASAVA